MTAVFVASTVYPDDHHDDYMTTGDYIFSGFVIVVVVVIILLVRQSSGEAHASPEQLADDASVPTASPQAATPQKGPWRMTDCPHGVVDPGPNVPRVYGSWASEICRACGAWRTMTHHGDHKSEWHPKETLEEALREDDEQ